MPKIQLSAIASDIKGKSNGSVFSKNSGGTYFRNAPSGGPRKTPRLQLQKARFGILATQYRALSNTQREAWDAAAVNYPTKNAFGAPRTPTGYELFMRLNANLLAAGQPTLTLPELPREVILPESSAFRTPDLFMFTPQRTINLGLTAFPTQYLWAEDAFQDNDFDSPNIISARFGASEGQYNFPQTDQCVCLQYLELNLGDKMSVVLTRGFDDRKLLVVSFVYRISVSTRQTGRVLYTVPDDFDINNFHMSVVFSVDGNLNAFVVLNGEQLLDPVVFSQSGIQPVVNFQLSTAVPVLPEVPLSWSNKDGSWYVGSIEPLARCPLRVSDVRFYNDLDTANLAFADLGDYNTLRLISLGYLTTYETAAIGAYEFANGFTANYANTSPRFDMRLAIDPECTSDSDCSDLGTGNDVECIDGVCTYVGDGPLIFSPSPFTYVPEVVFDTTGAGDPSFLYNLQCSGGRSPGRSPRQVKYTNLAFTPGVDSAVLLTNFLRSNYGSFAGGVDIAFKVPILDATTGLGYVTDVPLAAGGGVSRFKAGAEMSGKVN